MLMQAWIENYIQVIYKMHHKNIYFEMTSCCTLQLRGCGAYYQRAAHSCVRIWYTSSLSGIHYDRPLGNFYSLKKISPEIWISVSTNLSLPPRLITRHQASVSTCKGRSRSFSEQDLTHMITSPRESRVISRSSQHLYASYKIYAQTDLLMH